jgi:hypothetical protein
VPGRSLILGRMSPEGRLAPVLLRQDGLVTLAQAVDLGISARTVQRRVRCGDWERVLPRVFLVGGHPHSDAVRVRAAGLWVGERGAVSGPAAAWWHGMWPSVPGTVEVTVPRGACPRPQPHTDLRRRALGSTDLVTLSGLRLTDKPLTALETAAAPCSWPLRTGPTRLQSAVPSRCSEQIDGWAWHMAVDRFRADRHKGNALVRADGIYCGSPGTT